MKKDLKENQSRKEYYVELFEDLAQEFKEYAEDLSHSITYAEYVAIIDFIESIEDTVSDIVEVEKWEK